jgi:hypothetical protein
MAIAALPLGSKVVEGVARGLTNDLVVLNGQVFRRIVVQKARRKSKKYPQGQQEVVQLSPFNLELHLNPLSLGIGAAALALVAGALVARVQIGVPTIGTVQIYKGPLADEFDAWKKRANCARLYRAWGKIDAPEERLSLQAKEILKEAQAAGCDWASDSAITTNTDWYIDGKLTADPTKVQICKELHTRHMKARADKNYTDASRYARQAQAQGCDWVKSG